MSTPQNPFEGQYVPEEAGGPAAEPAPGAWEAFGTGLRVAPPSPEAAPVAASESEAVPAQVPANPGLPVSMPIAPPTAPAAGPGVSDDASPGPDGMPVAPPAAFGFPPVPASVVSPVTPPITPPIAHPAALPSEPLVSGEPVAQPPVAPGLAPMAPVAPMAPIAPPMAPMEPVVPMAPASPAAPPSASSNDGPVAPLVASAPTYQEVTERVQDVSLDDILLAVSEAGGSDLHLASDAPPRMRVRGEIIPIKGFSALTGEQVKNLIYGVLTAKQQQRYEENLGLDLSYTVPGQARFRVNVFQQRGLIGAVMRSIPWEILTFEALNIPASIGAFSDLKNGLVLVTGPTGSGKSTTLAALIDRANRTRPDHIMTIEDPIEFIHQSRRCIVNQREVGTDTHSFADALKLVLRQDPDIILVGEMRDLETISIALTAAETGHLVFGTLHTQSAQDTITRIVDAYPAGEKAMVRTQLAASLRAVVCQTLVPTADGTGRQAALEVMVANSNIKSLIRTDKLQQIQSALQAGAQYGMWTLNQDLSRHVLDGVITLEAALDRCSDREDLLNLVGGGDANAAEGAAARALKRAEEARQPDPGPLNPGSMFGGFPPPVTG